MVPMKGLPFESGRTKQHKNNQGDDLLDHLELHQAERAAIVAKPNTVGWHLKAVLKQSQEPAEQDDTKQWQMVEPAKLLAHLQVTIPSTRHENVGYNQ